MFLVMNMLPSERQQQKLSLLPCCEGSSIARKDNETDEERMKSRKQSVRNERKEPTASLLLILPIPKRMHNRVFI